MKRTLLIFSLLLAGCNTHRITAINKIDLYTISCPKAGGPVVGWIIERPTFIAGVQIGDWKFEDRDGNKYKAKTCTAVKIK